MIGRHDTIKDEIYTRVKHMVDGIYRKKGLSTPDIRRYFLIKKNFKRICKVMGDIKYIYDENKYPIPFESQVYDILFYRVLMDRIYYEKDNPQEESNLENYNNFIKEARAAKAGPKLKQKMIKGEDVKGVDIKKISTRHLGEIVADYEYRSSKSKTPADEKKYSELAKVYQDEMMRREKEMHVNFMKRIDKDGHWISKPK